MRVAWTHTFPASVDYSGTFMHTLVPYVVDLGVEVRILDIRPFTGPLRVWTSGKRLSRYVSDCDIVHAQYGSGCGFVSARMHCPKVITLRGSDWTGYPTPDLAGKLHSRLGMALSRAAVGRYDAVVVVSERLSAHVMKRFPDLRVDVLPSGVNLSLFKPCDKRVARDRLGCGDDPSPWVLFAQPSKTLKRAWLAEKAVSVAKRRIPALKLVFLEGCPKEDVPLWLNASDLVLLTSTSEGWPNIVKEALACNVPFVSTDVSDLRAIAEIKPSCSVVSDDPEALGGAICRVLERPRSSSLRDHALAFGGAAIATKLVEIYDRLLAQRAEG